MKTLTPKSVNNVIPTNDGLSKGGVGIKQGKVNVPSYFLLGCAQW